MKRDYRDNKLMHTVLQAEKKRIDDAQAVREAANQNVGAFSPDLAFEKVVNNYRFAKQLMGDTLLRQLTGYDSSTIERNINIPEFQREMKDQIKQNVDELRDEGILDKEYEVTDEGYRLATLNLIQEELDDMQGAGHRGEKQVPKRGFRGDVKGYKKYEKGQPYREISPRRTVRLATRRGRRNIQREDLVAESRETQGSLEVVYLVDTSGSMKGNKIRMAKKAGVALAHRAQQNGDDIGAVLFSNKVHTTIPVGSDLFDITEKLVKIRGSGETDLGIAIEEGLNLFTSTAAQKHIILLSDALQTRGSDPERTVLTEAVKARAMDASISVLGIGLDEEGTRLAQSIVDKSNGKLYAVSDAESLNEVVIQDYASIRKP